MKYICYFVWHGKKTLHLEDNALLNVYFTGSTGSWQVKLMQVGGATESAAVIGQYISHDSIGFNNMKLFRIITASNHTTSIQPSDSIEYYYKWATDLFKIYSKNVLLGYKMQFVGQ